jgi:uncharacterized protein YqgC (DUF456 family)
MDILLIIISLLFMVLGIAGSFLPILPGPLTSWLGLLILHFTSVVPMNKSFLMITFSVALAIWFLDYIIPVIGTKRFGGSKTGVIGTSIGLFVGLIAPIPGGIIIGPFWGALIGELLNKSNFKNALKAAFGSFLGFITSTFLKFIVSIIYFGFFLLKLFDNSDLFV